MRLSTLARGLGLATLVLAGQLAAGCNDDLDDAYDDDGWADEEAWDDEDGWEDEDPDATARTTTPPRLLYTYEVRINNKATARDVQIRFSCNGTVTTKTIAGSNSNTKSFYCVYGPGDSRVKMKWRANIAGKWSKVEYIYYDSLFGTSKKSKEYERWWTYRSHYAPQLGGNGVTEKLCFYTYEPFQGVKIVGESCE